MASTSWRMKKMSKTYLMNRINSPIADRILISDANGQAVDSGLDIDDVVIAKPNTFAGLQQVVRAGVANKLYEVGDEIIVHSSDLDADIIFKVMHMFDGNTCGALKLANNALQHGMILQTKNVIYYSKFPFSPQQAFYYAEDGLAAGTYNITIPTAWGQFVAGTFQFTLANAVPAKGQLVFSGDPYSTALTSLKVKSYASAASTTAIETTANNIIEGSGGTALGTLDGSGNCNHYQRTAYGCNRWAWSFERQYLNAEGSNWFKAMNKFDRYNSWAGSHVGFKSSLDQEFVSILADVDVTTIKNTVCDGGGTEVTRDKFFLPNRIEAYMTAENASETGVAWDFYKDFSDLSAPGTGADSNRIKQEIGTSTARYWWLRTPHAGYAVYVRFVHTDGSISSNNASNSSGCAPACIVA